MDQGKSGNIYHPKGTPDQTVACPAKKWDRESGPPVTLTSKSKTVEADWLMPYGPNEVQYVAQAIRSAEWQQEARIHLHLLADGVEPVEVKTHLPVSHYHSPVSLGPYAAANALSHQAKTEWLCIVDVDDTSLPNRTWESIATAKRYGIEHIGGAMLQFVEDQHPDLVHRMKWDPYLLSGRTHSNCPFGVVTNAVRCVSTRIFRQLNGFEDWPTAADFEFTNRAYLMGIRPYFCPTVWGLRRLRSTSITNTMPEKIRVGYSDELIRRLTLPQQGYGALDKSPDIELLYSSELNR